MSLDLSLGEFSALTAKALRGAGYHWGLATDGAYAARVLAQAGLPAADIIVSLLGNIQSRSLTGFLSTTGAHLGPNMLCPLALGAALSDLGEAAFNEAPQLLESQSVLEPLLLAPALRRSSIYWRNGQADVDNGRVQLIGKISRGATAIRIEPLRREFVLPGSKLTRTLVDEAIYESLLAWASLTYAPASEASRQAGAGAGTTDND